MAPIKFEEHIKDKLEKRTIQPDASAWSILEGRLDASQQKSTNKRFWYLGVAATLAGLLLVTLIFFKEDASKVNATQVVDIKPENKTESVAPTLVTEKKEDIISVPTKNSIVTDVVEIKQSPKVNVPKTKAVLKQNKSNGGLATLNEPKIKDIKEAIEVIKPVVEIPEDVVANMSQVTSNETINNEVQDSEIDQLLNQAQQDMSSKSSSKTLIIVDSNGLLQDVEDELEETFRDKMFKTFKKGYDSVKSTVAERNE